MPELIRRKSDGAYFIVDPAIPGGLRPASDDEVTNARVRAPEQAQGVSGKERFIVTNLTRNGKQARAFLDSVGYETRKYGDGDFDIAVRKGQDQPWRVVDPEGFEAQDLADLVTDAVGAFFTGAASVAGSAGGLPGAALAGGAASAGFEGFRQLAGAAAGVPDNVGAGEIALQGAAGALAEPVGRFGIAAARRIGGAIIRTPQAIVSGAGKILPELGARVAGFKSRPGLDATEALLDRVAIPSHIRELPTSKQAGRELLQAIQILKNAPPIHSALAHELASEAAAQNIPGLHVNFRTVMDPLLEYMRPTARGRQAWAVDPDLGQQVREVLQRIYLAIPRGRYPLRQMPVDDALKVKDILQEISRKKGAYAGRVVTDRFKKLMRSAAANTREQLERVMSTYPGTRQVAHMSANTPTTMTFAELMYQAERRAARKAEFVNAIGTNLKKAQNYVKNVYADDDSALIVALEDLSDITGVDVLTPIRHAAIGSSIGARGVGRISPKFTPIGNIYGPSALTAVTGGLGFMGGGLAGAGLGLAAGAAMASPRSILGMTRFGTQVVGPAVRGATAGVERFLGQPGVSAGLEGAARTAAVAGLREIARQTGRGVARQDERKRRRARFTGG